MPVFSAIIYPNGEFGIGYLKREKKLAEEKRFDNGIVHGIKNTLAPREHELEDGRVLYDSGDKYWKSFILDSPPKSSQSERYGLKGMTSYGKKMVRNGCFLLEGRLKRLGEFTQFSTLTIPPMGENEEQHICSKWSELTRKFFQECKRQYKRHARTFHYVSVTEIQPKRWAEKRFVGLHLHFVYNAMHERGTKNWVLTDTWVRDTWVRIINNALYNYAQEMEGEASPISWVSYKRLPVKKSAENYLGKYMSKGGAIVQEVLDEKGAEYLPKQWWSMNSLLKVWIKKLTINSRNMEVVEHIINCIKNNDEEIIYWYEAVVERSGYHPDIGSYRSHFKYGYGGKMHPGLLQECKILQQFGKQLLTRKYAAS